MTHSHKSPKSRMEGFRLDVPKHLVPLVGKTSWKFSLKTTDPALAAIRRAQWTAHYKAEIVRLNGLLADRSLQDSREAVGRALELLAIRLGSIDEAIRAHLLLITHQARHSWGGDHAREADWDLGFAPEQPGNDNSPLQPFPGFEDNDQKNAFVTRLRWLEGRGFADGIVYKEIASGLLEREAWPCAELALLGLLSVVGLEFQVNSPEYDSAAKELLTRLANHEFKDWQPRAREALTPAPEVSAIASFAVPSPRQQNIEVAAPTPMWPNAGARSDPSQTLSAGLLRWKEAQKPGKSGITEGARAVDRFIELYGDRHVASITVNEIFDFRDFLQSMPRGLSLPAIQSAGKTLRAVVEDAHAKERINAERALAAGMESPEPLRLAPTSIKKDIGALSAIFAALRSERWILQNPAEKIPIDGYSKGKKVYPFRPDMMKRLFESPMFTGCEGLRPKKRKQAGPYVFQDTLYWSFLFAASVGHRMSEIAVALTENVEEAIGPNGETIVGIFIMDAKNEFSQRVIIVHPELLSLGFMNHVRERRRAGKTNLFDLPGGGASKLSERLNAYIDAVVVNDRRFVFHSMRHEFADRSEIDVGVELSKKIMGHARGRLYGLGAPLHHAAAELNKIDMSFVDWNRLRQAACTSASAAEAA